MKALASLGVLTSLVIAVPAIAGVVLDMETKDLRDSKVATSQILAQGHMLKMTVMPAKDDKMGKRATVIFNGERREMMMIDEDSKTYFVLDEKTMSSMAGKMMEAQGQTDAAMEQMKEALANVPEEQRAMVEKMMKERAGGKDGGMAMGKGMGMPGAMPQAVPEELMKTGEKKTLNGYATTKYEVYQEKQKTREMWVTGWDKIEGGKEVAALFGEMADFYKDMMDSFAKQSGMSGMAAAQMNDEMFDHLKEMDGVPVVTREFAGGKAVSESTLRSSKRENLDAATFQPPKGYTLRTMESLGEE